MPEVILTWRFSSALAALPWSLTWNGRQRGVGALDEVDVDLVEVERGEVLVQDPVDQLRQRPGELHAGRAAAHHHERQQPLALGRVVGPRRVLEAREQVVAQGDRLADVVEPEGRLGDLGVLEVVVRAPGAEDQVVVGDRSLVGLDRLPLEVDRGDAAEAEVGIGVLANVRPDRVGDLGGLEHRGRHLIDQRREALMVVLVDEDQFDVGLA